MLIAGSWRPVGFGAVTVGSVGCSSFTGVMAEAFTAGAAAGSRCGAGSVDIGAALAEGCTAGVGAGATV
jgi:hypothetical protein